MPSEIMNEQKPTPQIWWDLDGTIGDFTKLSYASPEGMPAAEKPVRLRTGIREYLQKSSAEGFQHCIVTTASMSYAQSALERAGIAHNFTGVFGNETVGYGVAGKTYQPVAEKLGLSSEDVRSNVIIIGDSGTDRPNDIDGVVFLHLDERALGASVISQIITKLLHMGHGDFGKGFSNLYARARQTDPASDGPAPRTFHFGNSLEDRIQCTVEYSTLPSAGTKTVPVISHIVAPSHENNWTLS